MSEDEERAIKWLELREENARLKAELAEKDASFELRWKSDRRAIKRWQEATGKDMEWPDHTDLSVWLLARLEHIEKAANDCVEVFEFYEMVPPSPEIPINALAAALEDTP